MPDHGCIVACLPNAQHWSVQLRLATGEFWYEEAGLLDRTHLRFFTRKTVLHLFESLGFRVEKILGRVFAEPHADAYLGELKTSLATLGLNAEEAVADARPLQYVLRAVPA